MRVVICGSVNWSFARPVENAIMNLRKQTHKERKELLIIHGGEPGPETIARDLCMRIGIDQVIYPAQKAMGDFGFKRRNQIMLQEHSIDLVVLFAHVLNDCNVVCDMIERANRKGIKIHPIDYESIAGRKLTQ